VNFSGSDSSDPDGTTLSYSWDLGNGADPNSELDSENTSTRYDSSGIKSVELEVTDDDRTACCGEESSCQDKDDTDTVKVTVVDLTSLELEIEDPNEGAEIDDEDEDEDTKSYIVKKGLEGVLTVTATPDPNDVELPDCWSLTCTQGSATIADNKKTAEINKTTTGKTVIQCTCGSTTKTVTVYVVNLEIINPQYLAENDPIDPNGRYCYNSSHPGVCNVSASGSTGISELNVDLEWTLTGISGSTLTSDPNTGNGASITFTYTELPSGNSGFGTKTITLTHPKIPSSFNTDTQEVEIYYTFAAKNWPGADPNGGVFPPGYNLDYAKPPYRFEKTNWYYYYSQTSAHVGLMYKARQGAGTLPIPPYTAHIGEYIENPRHNHLEGRNGGEILWGIDCFAWASRHEKKHSIDFNKWWPDGWESGPGTQDEDRDMLRDPNEESWPSEEGGPYDPEEQCTYKFHWYNAATGQFDIESPAEDCEWECVHTQQEWNSGSLKDEDWAYQGSRWH